MFESLQPFPVDPILGVISAFAADQNPHKVDLGVGVFKDEAGKTPIPAGVKEAEQIRFATESTKTYFPQVGNPLFNQQVQSFIFGDDCPPVLEQRALTVQTPGGSGSLKLGGTLLGLGRPGETLWMSSPTWNNHAALLSHSDLQLRDYPYYDHERHEIRFAAMLESLAKANKGEIVLLHGCCHNPTGADLSDAQWAELADLVVTRELFPYIDLAYHGLARGVVEDVAPIRMFASRVPEMLVSYSCSKNFGLYRERVGALTVIGRNTKQTEIAFGQVLGIARRMYSVPPSHGQAIVGIILNEPKLKTAWLADLARMRDRLNGTRAQLSQALAARGAKRDFSFIAREYGMFSLLGLDKAQIRRLREEFSVYMIETSRINVAGINRDNLDYLADAICKVL